MMQLHMYTISDFHCKNKDFVRIPGIFRIFKNTYSCGHEHFYDVDKLLQNNRAVAHQEMQEIVEDIMCQYLYLDTDIDIFFKSFYVKMQYSFTWYKHLKTIYIQLIYHLNETVAILVKQFSAETLARNNIDQI